ncbi:DUF1611 domain-containing protein [Alteromonas sp. a30]|uniref:DUF1611 domain-containing protein n=1 Tax=Alteromonas sp. a30 TaxID=2730917 RepID=UPI002280C367|nr:DUF1611 domain-containing protein [Alteromonas sp. a30]MCY7294563.1 DUF1611 domain-containing protein [Alteromonas sp. a30]
MVIFNRKKVVIYAEGRFNSINAKVAASFLRYHAEKCIAVIDSTQEGKKCQEILGYAGDIPVVKSLSDVIDSKPDIFLIGNGLFHNELPAAYREQIKMALESGMDVVSGIHFRLADDPEFAELAQKTGAVIWDTKEPPKDLTTSQNLIKDIEQFVVHTVGSDCRVGKKTTALEICNELSNQGIENVFAATGQSGIYISGKGIAIDAVPGDFIAGATEKLILDSVKGTQAEVVLLEGQGSITHPAYSSVTLGLLHGAMPQALILCHEAGLKAHKDWEQIPLLPLNELIKIYETLGSFMRPCKIVGISVNCAGLTEDEAEKVVAQIESETGLPSADVIKQSASKLVKAINNYRRTYVGE